jgi:hypothetical protein
MQELSLESSEYLIEHHAQEIRHHLSSCMKLADSQNINFVLQLLPNVVVNYDSPTESFSVITRV